MWTNVERHDNHIVIRKMNHPAVTSDFIRCVYQAQKAGYQDLIVEVRVNGMAYPDVCAPIAGVIEYYRIQGIDFDISYPNSNNYVENAHFHDPVSVGDNLVQLRRASLDDIWRFHDFEDVTELVNAFVSEISQTARCGPGVLNAIEWCLNEVMDNVLQHSNVEYGYVMGQVHQSSEKLAFCVFDYGQGIYNSLRGSQHEPRYPVDAITLSIKEGVTRDKKIGQGNGLWGLHNIIQENEGRLSIVSSGASYMLTGNEIRTFDRIPYLSRENGASTIDFQIDYSRGISISKALGGHEPLTIRLDDLENDDGVIAFRIADRSSGTGTRRSGTRIRTELMNLYSDRGTAIEVDFDSVSVISSSFADEMIGKLVAEYGFFGFNRIFRLKNMNSLVQSIVNRSVAQRMSQSFVSGSDSDESADDLSE